MSFLKNSITYAIFAIFYTSYSLFGSNSVSYDKLCELEARYPVHFKGFKDTDLSLIKHYRDQKKMFEKNPELFPKFKQLHEELVKINNPQSNKVLEDITLYIKNEEQQTPFNYILSLAKASLSVSEKTEEESLYSRLVGFRYPYGFIDFKLNDRKLIDKLKDWTRDNNNHDSRGDFKHITHKIFYGKSDNFSKKFERSSFNPFPNFIFCTEKNQDILGFFYLAWTYCQGIHPVPVTLLKSDKKLHGIKMSPWGKSSHDLAHLKADSGENSVEQFSNNIGNHYLDKLNKNLKSLSFEQKKNTG